MITGDILSELKKLQDKGYRKMQITTIPSVKAESIIGVRTPALRALAKELSKRDDISIFLEDLPHKFFEENQLHAFILSCMKDAEECIKLVDKFLPYVDNWATCDQMSPKIFKKHKDLLLEYINEWIKSDKTYVKRFAVGMLMEHFLDEDFKTSYLTKVSRIRSDEYFINMMTHGILPRLLPSSTMLHCLISKSRSLINGLTTRPFKKQLKATA